MIHVEARRRDAATLRLRLSPNNIWSVVVSHKEVTLRAARCLPKTSPGSGWHHDPEHCQQTLRSLRPTVRPSVRFFHSPDGRLPPPRSSVTPRVSSCLVLHSLGLRLHCFPRLSSRVPSVCLQSCSHHSGVASALAAGVAVPCLHSFKQLHFLCLVFVTELRGS